MPDSPSESTPETFQDIDWSSVDPPLIRISAATVSFAFGILAFVAVFLYDRYVAHVYLVGTWNVQSHEWMFLFAVVAIVSFGVVPVLMDRRRARKIVDRTMERRLAAASVGYLVLLIAIGLITPWIVDMGLRFEHQFHPPVGFSSPAVMYECLGTVSTAEDGFTRQCHGSLAYPLGTNDGGHDMLHLVASGMRVALFVGGFTVGIIIPIATAVGVIAGYFGGRIDDVLMAYVDVQLSIPAILVYFIAMIYFNPQLWMLLLIFGLLSWGGIARLVRSEVLQRREEGFILAAESAGASRFYVARRHLLPNVSNTVIPAAFHLIAILILTEAGLSFLGFHDDGAHSWGRTIAEGLDPPGGLGGLEGPLEFWWVSTLPAIALGLTVLGLKLAGDSLRDAFDPREEQ